MKNYDKTNEQPVILCPCPAPKRLLTSSNWISRNDSSNISAVLHPENYLYSPRLKYGEKTKGDVIVKQPLSRNNCYCRCKNKKLPRPSFFKRPNSCISYEALSKIDDAVGYEGDFKRKSLLGCVCKEVDDEASGPEPCRSRVTRLKQAKSLPAEVGLKYSNQREKYEEYRQIQEEKFRDKLQDYDDNEQYEKLEEVLGAGDSGNVETILGTQKYGTASSISNYQSMGSSVPGHFPEEYSDDIPTDVFPAYSERSVPEFRREHYFETHNIGKLGKIAGDVSKERHTCVHQFKLNNRWLPEPLNKDVFGRSVCKICEKPMEGSSINLSSGYLFNGDSSISRSRIKNYAEAYKHGLSPTTINLGRGKSNIELVLKDKDVTRFNSYINRNKKPVYYNSLALRHQKLRVV